MFDRETRLSKGFIAREGASIIKLIVFSLLLPKLRFLVRAVVVAQVVAHQTTDQEIVGSIPAARSWAFSLLHPIRSVLIRSLVEVQHS